MGLEPINGFTKLREHSAPFDSPFDCAFTAGKLSYYSTLVTFAIDHSIPTNNLSPAIVVACEDDEDLFSHGSFDFARIIWCHEALLLDDAVVCFRDVSLGG